LTDNSAPCPEIFTTSRRFEEWSFEMRLEKSGADKTLQGCPKCGTVVILMYFNNK
jgi:hypothetical protein